MRLWNAVCLCAAAGVAIACGGSSGGGGSTPVAPSPTVTGVAVTLASSVLRIRETTQATATATLSNGQTQAVTTGFRSDAPDVATVSDGGLVTAVAAGLANIYVVFGGSQGLAQIRVAVFPATLTFDGLSPGAAFSGYASQGFAVQPVSGAWLVNGLGNPGPAIVFRGSEFNAPPAVAEVEVTRGGEVFAFTSVDLYSSVTRIPWEFTGYRRGVQVFTASGEQPNTFGRFVTTTNPRTGDGIDRLVIKLTQPANTTCATCGGNPMGLDNLVLY